MDLEKSEILELEKKINNTIDNFWLKLQSRSERIPYVIYPPLNSIVYEKVCKLLVKKSIIWIGGPTGVGKTTCTKRFQNYGFMVLDSEDRSFNRSYPLPEGLTSVSQKIYNELNCSFVIGAAKGKYMLNPPEYIFPVLILPEKNVYKRRFKKCRKSSEIPMKRYQEDLEISNTNKDILVLHQPIEESIDTTIYRICDLIINSEKFKKN